MRQRRLLILGTLVACLALAGTGSAVELNFTSPSGNIDCRLADTGGRAFANCLVQRAQWTRRPARPASCDFDWVPNEVSLTRGRLTIGACRSDVGPLCGSSNLRCVTLRYGQSRTVGRIRCTSRENGMTCRYTTGSRIGFRLNRSAYTRL
jgi:hypothetical protein